MRSVFRGVFVAVLLALVVARAMDVPMPDQCHNLTPDDWFWWWFYGCGKEAGGGGGSGAGYLLLLPSMVHRLRAWLSSDPPDRELVVQLRDLWRVSPDWTHQPTARVVTTRRRTVRTFADWMQRHGERKRA